MSTFEIQILDENMNIIEHQYYENYFQEAAEHRAQILCKAVGGYTYQVLRIK